MVGSVPVRRDLPVSASRQAAGVIARRQIENCCQCVADNISIVIVDHRRHNKFRTGPPGSRILVSYCAQRRAGRTTRDRIQRKRKARRALPGAQARPPEFQWNAPICPKCGLLLLKRNGLRGEFGGCLTFPKCTGTRNLYGNTDRKSPRLFFAQI